ncbi:MAG: 7-carboxy-7-deazaguanine synthase QueE [Candidatus Omnitrophica bacterium]|nr:7-carboxy-7-deazaguanine synthase QueE [Candidatus Omnitrophota bacterium]
MIAKISEIFKSIQGEGIYQGVEQVFVRFFGCNLACAYCDTRVFCHEEKTLEELMQQITAYGDYHSVSFTGGEPLLQAAFLKEALKSLKRLNKITYLETNGVLYNALWEVIEYCDIISMDFKLPSSTLERALWDEHREFLKVAKTKEVFVKAVIGKDTQLYDITKSIEIIKAVSPKTTFILQPQHPFEEELAEKLAVFEKICQEHGITVEIVSQLHKQLGIK